MTPREIADAGDRELSRRRLELLQAACPVCDEDRPTAVCTCIEDLKEVELIDTELRTRGRKKL